MADYSFSALRIDGKRAYEYARLGQELPQELTPRTVKVSNLELVEWFETHTFPVPNEEAPEEEKKLEESISSKRRKLEYKPPANATSKTSGPACKLRMTVSGGFYVRSLCYDLGLKVDSGGYMAELVRTKQGDFTIDDAVAWEDFVEGGGWEEKVVDVLQKQSSKQSERVSDKKATEEDVKE